MTKRAPIPLQEPYLRNAWYQVGWSFELDDQGHIARTVLGEPLLVFRDAAGAPRALADMCPHRFAPLSRGRIAAGVVTCGYHGLGFDGAGTCIANPHGPPPKGERVRSYPMIERHAGLWAWLGEPSAADPARLPDLDFIDRTPPTARIFGHMPTAANYLLASDNIMDLSHADYLHPTTLGGIMTGAKTDIDDQGNEVLIRWMSSDVVPPAAFRPMLPPGSRADIWTEMLWGPPAVMVLNTGAVAVGDPRTPEREALTLHNMTPETSTSCHYFYCSTRRFLVDDVAFSAYLAQTLEQAFVNEDKPMLEAQQARIGDRDFWDLRPMLLSIDAGAVRARRKLQRLIEAEQTTAHAP